MRSVRPLSWNPLMSLTSPRGAGPPVLTALLHLPRSPSRQPAGRMRSSVQGSTILSAKRVYAVGATTQLESTHVTYLPARCRPARLDGIVALTTITIPTTSREDEIVSPGLDDLECEAGICGRCDHSVGIHSCHLPPREVPARPS